MFKNLKLAKKFNLVLLLIFMVGILLAGAAFAAVLADNTKTQVTSKALIMIQTMNSVRAYTSTRVNPLLAARLETDPEFIPETVPGYAAREVFEHLRQNPDYQEFFYKEATLNPTNLRDKADSFETVLVEEFRAQPSLKELSGFRRSPGGDLYYIARPIQIGQQSCLRCHSTPEAAPASMLATYGRDNGFGWQLNEIVGAQIVSVPAGQVFQGAYRAFFFVISIAFVMFALAIILVNILLNRAVIRPLNRMIAVADQVSTGSAMDVEFDQGSNDEIGALASAFNRMKLSLVMAMKMLNRPTSQG